MSDLAGFLLARYDEAVDRLYDSETRLVEGGRTADESFRFLVEYRDQVSVLRTTVNAFVGILGSTDSTATITGVVLWRLLLVQSQPYEQHPDFDPAWLTELATLIPEDI